MPTATVTLGGTDISTRVGAPLGGTSLRWGRAANLDGGAAAPGYCVAVVRNDDKAFNPANASSPYAAVLKIGQSLRVTATHSATYYLFDGFVRRIVPLDNGFAEIHAQDALFLFSRREVSLPASLTRTIVAFRGAILDEVGVTSGQRSLTAANGAEAMMPYTGASGGTALNLLDALCEATGTVQFVTPISTGWQYKTLDRLALQSNGVVETFSDTDFTQPFAVELETYDYTDETVINEQRVEAHPRLRSDVRTTVWTGEAPFTVGAGSSRTLWAEWTEPVFNANLNQVTTGSPTVTFTPFSTSAKIVVTAGATAATVQSLSVTGDEAPITSLTSTVSEDATSKTDFGTLRGTTISSDFLMSSAHGRGLGDWIIQRYKTPRATPNITVENRFPSQLQREVADRITLTSSVLSLSAAPFHIRSFETQISGSGARWTTKYELEGVPALWNLFTLGGTAAQGVGGSGVLGY